MARMNRLMVEEMARVDLYEKNIPGELLKIIRHGFFECDGCFFLSAFSLRLKNVSKDEFPDKTGYECFVNSINIDDYVSSDFLSYTTLFVESLLRSWREDWGDLQAIISASEFGVQARFHVVRDHESWLSDELEDYAEAIWAIKASELAA